MFFDALRAPEHILCSRWKQTEAFMNIAAGARRGYRVTFRPEDVERAEMGPTPTGRRVRCTVPLTGDVNEAWRTSYRAVQLEDTGFFRFRLEMESNTVAFVVNESRGTSRVTAELKTLSFLLDAVNALAGPAPVRAPSRSSFQTPA